MYKTLDRNKQFMGQDVPDWATAATCTRRGDWYFEESLRQEDGQRFQRIRGFDQGLGAVVTYGPDSYRGFTKAVKFSEAVEQDDPLPPAPESVRYNDEYPIPDIYERTWLDVRRDPHHIYLESGQYGTTHGVGMVLGPDAALQLAHDLNRMANKIKRRERARSGE